MKQFLKTIGVGAIVGLFFAGTLGSATVLFPTGGGTGTSTIPSIGQVLIGQSNGTYAPQATSTLGISISAASSTGAVQFNCGNLFCGNTAKFFWDNVTNFLGIGGSSPQQALDIKAGNINFTRITAPASAPTLAVGTAGALTGNYRYLTQYVNAYGQTSNGTISAIVSPSAQRISLSSIPISSEAGVTGRAIYRTEAGGGVFFFLTLINDNTTTTYTDNATDASINTNTTSAVDNKTGGMFYLNNTVVGLLTDTSIVLGKEAGSILGSGAANNVFIGQSAGKLNVSGVANTIVGPGAGAKFTGSTGAFFGSGAAANLTTGGFNTAIGGGTLGAATTNGYNTAVGYGAMQFATGIEDVYIGVNAGQSSGTGDNVGIGYQAMQSTSGFFNVAMGYSVASALTSGTSNTLIGALANVSSGSIAGCFALGRSATCGASNVGILGGTGSNAISVGIGMTTPAAFLHVIGATEQFRLGYDASNYYSTTVGSTGGVTFDAIGSGAKFSFSDQLIGKGTATNDDAAATYIGEYISASVVQGSATALTTATPKTVTSISLTAGDWDISAVGALTGASTGTIFDVAVGTTTNSFTGTVLGDTRVQSPTVSLTGADASLMIPGMRVSISGTATYYLVVSETFTLGSPAAYGRISARRVR